MKPHGEIPLFYRSFFEAEQIKHRALKAEIQLRLARDKRASKSRMGRSSKWNLLKKHF